LLDSHPHQFQPKLENRENHIESRPRSNKLRWMAATALLIAIGIVIAGVLVRRHREHQVTQWTVEQAVPTVAMVKPKQSVTDQQLVLPGNIKAWHDAPIYARVSGYLKAWYLDFGAQVQKGQLLAEIDAPDLDARFAAAKARLAYAKDQVKLRDAERNFAETTYSRWRESPKGVVSEQETEAKKADFGSSQARYNAAVAEANVDQSELDRLAALETFKRIVAPFDGIVTARNTDVGALINAGSGVGAGTGPQLFRVADVHEMRVFVQVPQEMSSGIHDGQTAEMTLPQYPKKTFKAVVSTTSESIKRTLRTLLVELHTDNAGGLLQPGAFAEVRFNLPDNPGVLRIPTSALIFREDGAQLAVVDPQNRVELRAVTLGRNLGIEYEVVKGLALTDTVVDRPSDSLSEGEVVKPEKEPPPPPAQEAAAK
jgi:RND family efflux transporter MFP subunit